MKRKYALIIGGGKPIYFDTIKERNKIIRGIKGAITYHTFHKDVKKWNSAKDVEEFSKKGKDIEDLLSIIVIYVIVTI